jgi:hypothetical protein
MSWSVSASGTPAEVRGLLSEQFKYPLAEKPAGLNDDGERETVQKVHELLEQVLITFADDQKLTVSAYGHIVYKNYPEVAAGQNVSITIGL